MLSMHGCPVSRLGGKDTGGMNVYVLQIARELGGRGHAVDVYTRTHDPDDPQIVDLGDNARVIHLSAGPVDEAKESLYGYIPEYLQRLEEFREAEGLTYDLVHSHYWLSGQAALSLAESWDVPHVTTFHTLARKKLQARPGETESDLRVRTESRVIESASAVVVSTDQEKDDLSRLYGVSPRAARTIPAGVDLDLFRPIPREEAKRSLGIRESNVVLSVGRIEPLKGLDLLVEATSMLNDPEDTRLIIVGGRPERDDELKRLESMAAELGVADRTTFAGAVKQAELPAYYSAADAFVSALLLRELRAGGAGGDGLRHARDRRARRGAEELHHVRGDRLSRPVALPGAIRAAARRAAGQPRAEGRDGQRREGEGADDGLGPDRETHRRPVRDAGGPVPSVQAAGA